MSTALYWGLPSHGTCLKRCRTCRQIVVVRVVLGAPGRRPKVVFFDESGNGLAIHDHQPDPMWIWRWDEHVKKQRSANSGMSHTITARGHESFRVASMKDRDRTKGTRVRGYDNKMRDCPFVEIDDTGEHF